MKKKIALLVTCLLLTIAASAQNFKAAQKQQERAIKAAYKGKKVTENEYNKLMNEQETIKQTIEKYEADDVLDPHEKNVIHDKLERAAKRLKKYKTNREVY